MKISIIVAFDEKSGIGKDNNLLCYLPADLKNFKKLTSGNAIIMGRKTFESLPNGALPNRRNIVITKNEKFNSNNIEITNSIDKAINLCKNENEIFIIGGAQIYNQFIKKVDYLYITKIHHVFDADTFFPEIDNKKWKIESDEYFKSDEKNKFSFSFIKLSRI
ncbi:MAG: dihydrofolate reductase [Bacteroidales bacterium]|nr:dihydrofolate reductase [Bacteroidales bacterium]MBN2758807.1 dihydrofolate reductase [Bacteroidales bacterium]